MNQRLLAFLLILAAGTSGSAAPRSSAGESSRTFRLPATADVWISNATPREREASAGGSPVFKLKSVEEMAALRFDLSPFRGRELLAARLHLRLRHPPAPRWLRVSTVGSPWKEGQATRAYSGRDGACWLWADASVRRPWAWPGSAFCDVIMGEGNSLVSTAPVRDDGDDWISIELPPVILQAILCGRSDGVALMEGGSPANRNYYFYSRNSWSNKPWLELTVGDRTSSSARRAPRVSIRPSQDRATLTHGDVVVRIAPDSTCFAWRAWVDGKPLPSWKLPWPADLGTTEFHLEGLAPSKTHHLRIEALGPHGEVSPPTEVEFTASPALRPAVPLKAPPLRASEFVHRHPPRLWALPALAQLDPVTTERLDTSGENGLNPWDGNGVWDGRRVHLVGARGETVSFQLIVQAQGREGSTAHSLPASLRIRGGILVSARGDTLESSRWSLFRAWYFRRDRGSWQPSYLVPIPEGSTLTWRSEEPRLPEVANRAFLAELAIGRDTPPGRYRGELIVELQPGGRHLLPVLVEVQPFILPARPGFRIELNAYHLRKEAIEQFRVARSNRCVFTPWVAAPRVVENPGPAGTKSAASFSLDWSDYDRLLGPLLDGSAFPGDPHPLEVLYLPLREDWPTPLTPQNYHYRGPWPGRGDPFSLMWEHHATAPPIEDALAPIYRERLKHAEIAFLDHFRAKGWTHTELHFFLNAKMKDRVDYGHSTWWNLDEPLYWPDWAALRFYLEFFRDNLPPSAASRWWTRADISRPEWLRGALGSAARIVYTGGPLDAAQARRCRTLVRDLHLRWQVYSAAGNENAPPAETAAWVLGAWMDGAQGVLVWQTLAPRDAWTGYDPPNAPGTALLATWNGASFSHKSLGERPRVAADLRVKALRDAQQLTEWLEIWVERKGLRRAQFLPVLQDWFSRPPKRWWHGSREVSRLVRYGTMDTERLDALRRAVIASLAEPAAVDSGP